MTTESITQEDIHKIAWYLASQHTGVDQEELYQIAYLEGLEALERGTNVYGAMRGRVSHTVSTSGSPVEVPDNGATHSAIAKMRAGVQPISASEKRIASVLGTQEEVLPITIVTSDTPETLLMDKQLMERLKDYLDYDSLFLTPQQRDAIGVVYFGKPLPEAFMLTYGVGQKTIYWHSRKAVEKIRKALG